MEVLGTAGTLRSNSPGALLRGRVERMHRSCLILTFGGGTNEIQRDIIGMVALGLPGSIGKRRRRFRMDFSTTEAADDLGGLARTIAESVCTAEHHKELDGLEHRLTATCGASSSRPTSCPLPRRNRWAAAGCRGARAGGGAGGAGPCAAPRFLTWSRWCSVRARWRSSVRERCSSSGRRRQSTARRSSLSRSTARWARALCRRPPAGTVVDRDRGPGRLRPGGGRVPGSGRNRFGHEGFPCRKGRRRRDGDGPRHHRPRQRRASGVTGCGGRSGRRRRRRAGLADHARQPGPQRVSAGRAGACAGAHVDLRPRTRAVRPTDQQLPGRVLAPGRRLHRREGTAAER